MKLKDSKNELQWFLKTSKITNGRWLKINYSRQRRARIFYFSAKAYFKGGTIKLETEIKFKTKRRSKARKTNSTQNARNSILKQRQIQWIQNELKIQSKDKDEVASHPRPNSCLFLFFFLFSSVKNVMRLNIDIKTNPNDSKTNKNSIQNQRNKRTKNKSLAHKEQKGRVDLDRWRHQRTRDRSHGRYRDSCGERSSTWDLELIWRADLLCRPSRSSQRFWIWNVRTWLSGLGGEQPGIAESFADFTKALSWEVKLQRRNLITWAWDRSGYKGEEGHVSCAWRR